MPEHVMESSVSPKGQVTIPVEIRRLLGVKPKDKVVFRVEQGKVVLQPARSALDELYQSVPALTELRSWDEIKQIAREERAESAAREGLE
jgi:AbrB family looped-hinge helix DNA binding protein